MGWIVNLTGRAEKQALKLPNDIRDRFSALTLELQVKGVELSHRPHYSKIRGQSDAHHCHLNKGRPTYVTCWRLKEENQIEVYYVGTHENAPY
jgi:hypothetical protein